MKKSLISIISASIISLTMVGCQSTNSWEHEYDFTYTSCTEEHIEKYRSNHDEEIEHLRNQDNLYKQVVKKGLEIVKEEDRALTLDEYNYLAYLLGDKKDFNYPKQLKSFEETCINGYNLWRDKAIKTQIECNNDTIGNWTNRNNLIDFELIKENIDRMLFELDDIEITNNDLVNMEQNIEEGKNKLRNTNFNSYYNGEDYNCDCFICGNKATLIQGDKGYDFYECVSCNIFTSIQDINIFLNNESYNQEGTPTTTSTVCCNCGKATNSYWEKINDYMCDNCASNVQCYDCGEERFHINEVTFNGRSFHCGCEGEIMEVNEPAEVLIEEGTCGVCGTSNIDIMDNAGGYMCNECGHIGTINID